jgi:Na+/H+-dicarboxylate symporter
MKKNSLILLGLILGVVVGILFRNYEGVINIIGMFGTLYIRLIKMIMVPLVFSSLVLGICSLTGVLDLGKIAVKTVVIFILTTLLAVLIGTGLASIFNLGNGMNLIFDTSNSSAPAFSVIDTIINIVPDNPIKALAESSILQVIFFAILVGIAISKTGEKSKNFKNFI